MHEKPALVASLLDGKQRFLALVADLRPELHRYCARMTGSAADGEDVVQETLARAYYALSEMEEVPALRPWLFQIAHNRAIDHLRRHERRSAEPMNDDIPAHPDAGDSPEDKLASMEATRLAIGRFCELVPAQRSVVVLKDVLGHSLEEIGVELGLRPPAVKSALHRGRERLRVLAAETSRDAKSERPLPLDSTVMRYAELFNARDWDGVRALLSEDVRLDLVTRSQRSGRRQVSTYFTNYGKQPDWHLSPARIDGREALAVSVEGDAKPRYFIELTTMDGRVTSIRDFRYVPYIASEATIVLATEGNPEPGGGGGIRTHG